jgi:hypothetical protein
MSKDILTNQLDALDWAKSGLHVPRNKPGGAARSRVMLWQHACASGLNFSL